MLRIFINRGIKNFMRYTKLRTRKYFAPQNEGKEHKCDFPGCTEKGEYRAPKDKNLKEYYWFCLKHVQEYNAQWNYYADENGEEEENLKRRMHFGGFGSKIKYQFGYDFIDELGIDADFSDSSWKNKIYFNAKDREYDETMELDLEGITWDSLKKQYKKLVKKYHPDVNSGDKTCEEKFKRIAVAYKELSARLSGK